MNDIRYLYFDWQEKIWIKGMVWNFGLGAFFDEPIFSVLSFKISFSLISLLPLAFQVDKGALRPLLGGANMMSPGFISKGGSIVHPAEAGSVVAIMVEGKENAAAVGVTLLSDTEVKRDGQGIAVETYHVLADGLWKIEKLE